MKNEVINYFKKIYPNGKYNLTGGRYDRTEITFNEVGYVRIMFDLDNLDVEYANNGVELTNKIAINYYAY